jgi:hypothetical protein
LLFLNYLGDRDRARVILEKVGVKEECHKKVKAELSIASVVRAIFGEFKIAWQ